jgi:hypothetical protein
MIWMHVAAGFIHWVVRVFVSSRRTRMMQASASAGV